MRIIRQLTQEIKNIESESSYEVSSADDVKNALIKSDQLANYNDISGIKAFPDDSLVTIEDDNIVIKAQGDFEVKLAINDRDAVTTSTYSSLASTAVATTTYSTYTYRNVSVAVSTATTVRYNINLINVGGEKGVNAVSEDDYRSIAQSLEEYFKDRNETNVEITNMTCDIDSNGKASMKIDYKCTDAAGNEVNQNMELVLHQESKNINADPTISDGDKKEYTMNDYLYQMKETTKTTFVVGGNTKDDCVKLNITGMGAMQIQVGANEGQILAIEIPNLSTLYMGVDNLNISTEDKATAAIDTIGKAINYLSGVRAKIGAYANRLEHIITNLDTTEENMTAAYSRIMDVDMATEMTEYSTVQVLVQASTSMLAQANERPQQVLQLLQ